MTGEHGALLSVRNLQVSFPTERGVARVVDGVTFQVSEGETLGVVGESGSGKSVTSLALLGLVPQPGSITEGEVLFDGCDLSRLGERELRNIRGSKLAMVFQDPMTSLKSIPAGVAANRRSCPTASRLHP